MNNPFLRHVKKLTFFFLLITFFHYFEIWLGAMNTYPSVIIGHALMSMSLFFRTKDSLSADKAAEPNQRKKIDGHAHYTHRACHRHHEVYM